MSITVLTVCAFVMAISGEKTSSNVKRFAYYCSKDYYCFDPHATCVNHECVCVAGYEEVDAFQDHIVCEPETDEEGFGSSSTFAIIVIPLMIVIIILFVVLARLGICPRRMNVVEHVITYQTNRQTNYCGNRQFQVLRDRERPCGPLERPLGSRTQERPCGPRTHEPYTISGCHHQNCLCSGGGNEPIYIECGRICRCSRCRPATPPPPYHTVINNANIYEN